MNRLVVNPGSPGAWEIQLKPGVNSLGRGDANDFQISDPSVSRAHCQIIVSDTGAIIKDLGSTNGTLVNRAPVRAAVLKPGQHFHLGGVEVLFAADAPGARPPMRIAVASATPAPAALVPPPLPMAARSAMAGGLRLNVPRAAASTSSAAPPPAAGRSELPRPVPGKETGGKDA